MTRFPGAPRGSYVNEHQRLMLMCQALGKTMSHSGDLLGATWVELNAITREAKRRLGGDNPIDGSETVGS